MNYLHPWVQQVCRCIPQHLHEAKVNLNLAPLRLDDVGAGLEVGVVDLAENIRPGQGQQVVVALEGGGVVGKPVAPEIGLFKPVALDETAHGPVEDEDAVFCCVGDGCAHVVIQAIRESGWDP